MTKTKITLKQRILKTIQKNSYGEWRNGEIGQKYEEYPEFLTGLILKEIEKEKWQTAFREFNKTKSKKL